MIETKNIEPSAALEVLKDLKDSGYNMLVDLTAVDHSSQGRVPRFEVVYRVASLDLKTGLESAPRVEVRCEVGTEPVLRSVRALWPIADWLEREVWDMFGIRFADRPDIKRLLMYEEFVGHPLRKDYPISKRQPLIGPKAEPAEPVNLNKDKPRVAYE
ncbi:MAG: NADH-quinone oxidoreductase subunit C [Elusimicrobia bacterium]|nr:NADH-quinone oxidoreductase subunit C [Elusimicrobiota bacterium]